MCTDWLSRQKDVTMADIREEPKIVVDSTSLLKDSEWTV